MKNFFNKLGLKKNKEKEPENEPQVKEPWKKPADNSKNTQSHKTMIGKKPDQPFLDKQDERSAFGSGYKCPSCKYPIMAPVSQENPCSNCSFTGSKEEDPKPTTSKKPSYNPTMPFNGLSIPLIPGGRSFSLINESNPDSSIRVELEDHPEVILNRENLDRNNPTISGKAHICIREESGKWILKDLSSNGATFIQALQPQPIQNGNRIILGNKVLRFACDAAPNVHKDNVPHKTMQFGQFQILNNQNSSFSLLDEYTGTAKSFNGQKVELNRLNIDPEEQSISGKVHACIESNKGNWTVTDKSSNNATFIQASQEVYISHKTRMILGNKIYRFEIG